MAMHLNKPYRIKPTRQKRYEAHYHMPADYALVVPQKVLGDEVLCDIRWEDQGGQLHVIHNAMFVNDSLVSLNDRPDTKLKELWEHYYPSASET
jgi:hypothetical protein